MRGQAGRPAALQLQAAGDLPRARCARAPTAAMPGGLEAYRFLLETTRKTGRLAPLEAAELLSYTAARDPRPFALLENTRKTGRLAPLEAAELLSYTAARDPRPFALLENS